MCLMQRHLGGSIKQCPDSIEVPLCQRFIREVPASLFVHILAGLGVVGLVCEADDYFRLCSTDKHCIIDVP